MRSERGFALSEVLIAVMILAVLSVTLVGVIPATVNGMRGAGQRAYAANLARQTFERLQRDGFDNLKDQPIATVSLNGTEFSGEVKVAQARSADATMMELTRAKDVVVTLHWRFGTVPKSYQAHRIFVRQI